MFNNYSFFNFIINEQMEFHTLKLDGIIISKITNVNLSKYLVNRAVLADYETKISLS